MSSPSTKLTPLKILQPHLQYIKEYLENPFSSAVLIGNWFEERFENTRDRKAIAPGIYGQSQCMQDKSVYNESFQQSAKVSHREQCEEFFKWRQQCFSNKYVSIQPNIKLYDGHQFNNNFTTLKDITYDIVPQQVKNIGGKSLGKRRLNDDYMRSFGNSTTTGLLRWKQCEKRRESNLLADVSHYKNNFKPVKITGKKFVRKAPESNITF